MDLEKINAFEWSKSIRADYEGYFTTYPECHPGWDRVLRAFFDEVRTAIPEPGRFKLYQVKEKFGELRLYYALEEVPAEAQAAVDAAAEVAVQASATTCEITGEPGVLINRNGYLTVRCKRLRQPGDVVLGRDPSGESADLEASVTQ